MAKPSRASLKNCTLFTGCPCISYIKFYLGSKIADYEKEQSIASSNATYKQSLLQAAYNQLRYLSPALFGIWFLIDFGDWIVNQEEYATATDSKPLEGTESRIVTILSYMQSQFVIVGATIMPLVFVVKSSDLSACLYKMDNVQSIWRLQKPCKRPFTRRLLIGFFAIIAVTCLHLLHFVQVIYVITTGKPENFWKIKKYFIWRIPACYLDITFETALLLAKLIPLPLYVFFVFVCATTTRICIWFNHVLQHSVSHVRSLYDYRQTLNFHHLLQDLVKIDSNILEVLVQMNHAFSTFLLALFLSNSLLLCSILARGFLSETFENSLSYLFYVAFVTPPAAILLIALVSTIILDENRGKALYIWQELAIAHQTTKPKVPVQRSVIINLIVQNREESRKLLAQLHKLTHQRYSLTIAGIAHVTRGFAITLLAGFIGLWCFLIERSEHYQTEQSALRIRLLMRACNQTLAVDIAP